MGAAIDLYTVTCTFEDGSQSEYINVEWNIASSVAGEIAEDREVDVTSVTIKRVKR